MEFYKQPGLVSFYCIFSGNMLKSNKNLALLLPSVQQEPLQLEIKLYFLVCVSTSDHLPAVDGWSFITLAVLVSV